MKNVRMMMIIIKIKNVKLLANDLEFVVEFSCPCCDRTVFEFPLFGSIKNPTKDLKLVFTAEPATLVMTISLCSLWWLVNATWLVIGLLLLSSLWLLIKTNLKYMRFNVQINGKDFTLQVPSNILS
ncbi:hypothetical protein BVRB_4g094010 [Beta vulgaris subsp. vulgaris]|nr:hypothetical protein BVRB_4g094010 [Beta vulgaris subsp. vulgaris]